MRFFTIALSALLLGSCIAPWFKEGGKMRGINPGISPRNSWADLRIERIKVHEVVPLGAGNYAIDLTIRIGARKKTYDDKKYGGIVEDRFTVQVFVRMKGSIPEDEIMGVNAQGDPVILADSVLIPLSFEPPSSLMFPMSGPPRQPDSNAVQVLPTTPVLPNPTPAGQLIVVKPPLNPGDSKEFRRTGFLSSYISGTTDVELVVRVDIYNDIHPEHDGDDKSSAKYKAPDFNGTDRTNNEGIRSFSLP